MGDIISIESGNMSGPTKNGVEYRINMCKHTPSCSYYQYHKGCPRILLVPVVHIEQVNWGEHPCTVKVVGFAAFFTEEYAGQGIENKVKGKFMRYVISAKGDENVSDSGLYTAKLCD
ncbi:hypothetical protein [Syntrophomonas palmitatica]|uniref:hypothetical protein n=1 Tax=Syntrophomonas palmitatica TaxID=402877 RepID=UPI0006D2184E|nr:hypothetical protein [Syntrophomonas palmitatica]